LDTVSLIFAITPISYIVALLIMVFGKLKFWLHITQSNVYLYGPSKYSLRKYQVIELINRFGFSCLSTAILPHLYTFFHLLTTVILAALIKGGTKGGLEMQLNFLGAIWISIVTTDALIKGAGQISSKSILVKAAFKRHNCPKFVY